MILGVAVYLIGYLQFVEQYILELSEAIVTLLNFPYKSKYDKCFSPVVSTL